MKLTRLEKIYGLVLAVIFGGIVLHAPLSVGLGVLLPDFELIIKSWKEILMLALVPLAVVIATKRQLWSELGRDWIFRIIVAYTAVNLLLIGFMYQGAAAVAAGLAINLRYILFFSLLYLFIKIAPQHRLKMLIIGAFGAMFVVVFGVLQLFLPPDFLKIIGYSSTTIQPYLTVDLNPNYVRINSTLRGPNPLGAYMVIVLAAMASLFLKTRYRLKTAARWWSFAAMAVGSLAVLWVSYSRSAMVAAAAALGVVLLVTVGRQLSRKVWIGTITALFAILGGIAASWNTPFIQQVLLHENPDGGSAISSNDDHVTSLATGIDRLLAQPLGGGIGSTGSASLHGDSPIIIENQYLFIAHEVGWVGLLLFLALFALILARLWQQREDWLSLATLASGVGLALIGLLLPVWADETVAIVWWGMAAIALAEVRYGKSTK